MIPGDSLTRPLPIADLSDFLSGEEHRVQSFIQIVGDSLADIGFFALTNHGIDLSLIEETYEQAEAFFMLDDSVKHLYAKPEISHQRGYTAFGVEHAKDNPAPDLKEFWQTGRTLPEDHPLKSEYATNIWPTKDCPEFGPAVDGLYIQMEELSRTLLEVCSRYLGKGPNWLPDMAVDGNTILRILHYPA